MVAEATTRNQQQMQSQMVVEATTGNQQMQPQMVAEAIIESY